MNFVPNAARLHFSEDLIFQSEVGAGSNIWLFEFSFEYTNTQEGLQSVIINHFNNFSNILLLSEIYVLTSFNNTFQVFEVYRKSTTSNMTVMLLCQITKNETIFLNKNEIWTRRKDLSGVHFYIGCIKYFPLVFKSDEVIVLSWHFDICTIQLVAKILLLQPRPRH